MIGKTFPKSQAGIAIKADNKIPGKYFFIVNIKIMSSVSFLNDNP